MIQTEETTNTVPFWYLQRDIHPTKNNMNVRTENPDLETLDPCFDGSWYHHCRLPAYLPHRCHQFKSVQMPIKFLSSSSAFPSYSMMPACSSISHLTKPSRKLNDHHQPGHHTCGSPTNVSWLINRVLVVFRWWWCCGRGGPRVASHGGGQHGRRQHGGRQTRIPTHTRTNKQTRPHMHPTTRFLWINVPMLL